MAVKKMLPQANGNDTLRYFLCSILEQQEQQSFTLMGPKVQMENTGVNSKAGVKSARNLGANRVRGHTDSVAHSSGEHQILFNKNI